MSKNSKSSACGDIKKHLRSHAPDASQDQDGRGPAEPETVSESLAEKHDIANIYTILTKISGDMEGITEIRKTTASMEAKLSALITRLDEVEKRVEFLEGSEKELKANPPASKVELDQLWDKIEDMENRSRRNNIRIVGIPEGKEGQDMVKFLDGIIPPLIDRSDRQLEIERAHRSPSQRPNSTDKPRPILARFLRSADRDFVLRAARNKGSLSWENNNIMVFPDFARSTQLKRERFKECKKILHTKKVSFALLYPAKLRIEARDGRKTFTCPRQAMAFIEKME